MSVDDFVSHAASKWLSEDGPESDIVISSRIRIARNVTDQAFPMLSSDEDKNRLIDAVERATQSEEAKAIGRFEMLRLETLSPIDRMVLVEKHLISPALIQVQGGAVLLRDDEEIAIMVNEEDHLRMQCLLPGYQLDEAYRLADRMDDLFEETLDFAFDEQKGYLTACPTNLGTGMRASVMLHLPALVWTEQINRILSAITHVGLTVRGIYGEGSDALGNLFQVSNQVTMGQSEEEILGNLHSVVRQIIEHERKARSFIVQEARTRVEDRVCRSYGILAYARQIDSKESLQRLSDVRLGLDMGIIDGVSASILKELMVATQPGFLQKHNGHEMGPAERDARRANLIRERLRQQH